MSLTFYVFSASTIPRVVTEYGTKYQCLYSAFRTMRDMLLHIARANDTKEEEPEESRSSTKAPDTIALPLYFDGIEFAGCNPAAIVDVDVRHLPHELPPIWVQCYPANSMMQIFVKTLTGQTLTVPLPTSATVHDLALYIQSKEQIPVDQQRLVYAGALLEMDAALSHYKIGDLTTLHLILRLRGGGSNGPATHAFADMSAAAKVSKTRPADEHDPAWTLIAPGINIEVHCLGKGAKGRCEATGKRAFIQWGTASPWILGEHGPRSQCSVCDGPVQLKGCAFTGCKWRWFARKAEGTLDVSAPWKVSATGKCHSFSSSSDGTGMATYETLMIMAYPLA